MSQTKHGVEEQLSELLDRRTFFVSTNATGQGKVLYRHREDASRIAQKNGHSVTVDRLYALKEEFGPHWAFPLWKIAVRERAEDLFPQVKEERPTRQHSPNDPVEYRVDRKGGRTDWVTEKGLWNLSWNRAIRQLRSEGYDVPDGLLW